MYGESFSFRNVYINFDIFFIEIPFDCIENMFVYIAMNATFWVDSFEMSKCERLIREMMMMMMTCDDCYAGRKIKRHQMPAESDWMIVVIKCLHGHMHEMKSKNVQIESNQFMN